ncbi:membrane-bound lytic murein transglycosylase C [Lebetimonas natsushimae]|uniref:Membrane-bound lytic murein transglycosylase C n=1 Tax=Lebetimonas natsushimae TaxID=1936991 RepID=A0A292YEA3_9BACT|nr:murein transglycosylase domain-containing protein [Lebetimonas natsushimae]GAX87629.1 membrane-bound lytic murein transglycosylase C [Lebetimonas natsushimae]
MKKIFLILLFLLTGCSVGDYQNIASIAVSKNPKTALKSYLIRKKNYYITHPNALAKDIKNFIYHFNLEVKKFTKAISIWQNPKKPTTKKLVKYSSHYRARAIIDFDRGFVKVETIDKNYKNVLKTALVNTMLMPEDPRSVDLFSDKIVLKGKPFLAGQVYDNEGKLVLYKWRANRYADYLIKHKLRNYIYRGQRIYNVTFPLAKNSEIVRAKKYLPYVKEYSKKYYISKSLILGIIKTESDFNPYAVSYVPAFGLMQIVPTTAGVEGYERAYGYKHIPSKEFLFVPKNNIHIGSAYLNLLYYRYLSKIKNPVSREYMMIAAYNSGIGNVLRVFNIRRDRAIAIVNSLSPKEVYYRLVHRLPTSEGRRYLPKVLKNRNRFVSL